MEGTNANIPEERNNDNSIEESPPNDQILFVEKTWIPQPPVIKSGQKWVQGYGSKSWENDSTGWNSKASGETWISANKNYATDPWVPKVPDEKSEFLQTSFKCHLSKNKNTRGPRKLDKK